MKSPFLSQLLTLPEAIAREAGSWVVFSADQFSRQAMPNSSLIEAALLKSCSVLGTRVDLAKRALKECARRADATSTVMFSSITYSLLRKAAKGSDI